MLTGLFARLFVEVDLKKEDADIAALTKEIRLLHERMERMEGKLDEASRKTLGS